LRVDEHGVIRVGATRVTLDTVIGGFLDGESPEAIADQYPSLSLSAVYGSITYYLSHRSLLWQHDHGSLAVWLMNGNALETWAMEDRTAPYPEMISLKLEAYQGLLPLPE
jgi:uncharacterized protein (DUF433 family)